MNKINLAAILVFSFSQTIAAQSRGLLDTTLPTNPLISGGIDGAWNHTGQGSGQGSEEGEIVVLNINVKAAAASEQQLSPKYWVQTDLRVPTWLNVDSPSFKPIIEMRLKKLVEESFRRQQIAHFGQNAFGKKNLTEFTAAIKVLNVTKDLEDSNLVKVVYLVNVNGAYPNASVVVGDLALLSPQEQGVYMGYVVERNKPYISPEAEERRYAWIIGVIFGALLGLLLCGWCVLFAYFNTCGRSREKSASTEHLAAESMLEVEQRSKGDSVRNNLSANGALVQTHTGALSSKHGETPIAKVYVKDDNAQTELTSVLYERYIFDDLRGIGYMAGRSPGYPPNAYANMNDNRYLQQQFIDYQSNVSTNQQYSGGDRRLNQTVQAAVSNEQDGNGDSRQSLDQGGRRVSLKDAKVQVDSQVGNEDTAMSDTQIKRADLVNVHQPINLVSQYGATALGHSASTNQWSEYNINKQIDKIFSTQSHYPSSATVPHPRPLPPNSGSTPDGSLQVHTSQFRSGHDAENDSVIYNSQRYNSKDFQIKKYLTEIFRIHTVTAKPCPLQE